LASLDAVDVGGDSGSITLDVRLRPPRAVPRGAPALRGACERVGRRPTGLSV